MKVVFETDPEGIIVHRPKENINDVSISRIRLDTSFTRVIPDLKWKDIFWIQTLEPYEEKYAPVRGDGVLVKTKLLIWSGTLSPRQERMIAEGSDQTIRTDMDEEEE